MINSLPTPVKKYPALSDELKIDLRVKHDDLFPFVGGGNKARKIKDILDAAEKEEANALVSAGSANSNHARVVAIAAARKGWPVHLIIHDKEDFSKGNLQLMKMAGAQLSYVRKEEVSDAMDKAMENFRKAGFSPYYIWGGGHTLQGMYAYYKAVNEFKEQSNGWIPEYVIHASGTGSTQSGLHVGFDDFDSTVKVIGISVARDKERGLKTVQKGVDELSNYLSIKVNNPVDFRAEWVGDGYEKHYPKLLEAIKFAAQKDGLITDPTYTGKALIAVINLCQEGMIKKGSKVLFWHTGGLINLFSNWQRMFNRKFEE